MQHTSPIPDERFKKWSLNSALALLISSTVLCTIGALATIKYLKSGDDVGVWLGVANTLFGLVGTILGCQIIQAVVRRLAAKSRA